MTKSEILEFIKKNNDAEIEKYLDLLMSNLKDSNKQGNRVGIYVIILGLLYFLIDETIVSGINIGPITLKESSVINVIIPPIFAFVFLQYMIIVEHKTKLIRNIGIV